MGYVELTKSGRRFEFMNIFESALCVTRRQFRVPRTKKRRIRNKWAARRENWKETPASYLMNGMLYCHPIIAQKLRGATKNSIAPVNSNFEIY